jgi:hypothetical protein
MSGYFDALIRSSGMTIGRSRPVSFEPEPSAIEVGVDRSARNMEVNTVRSASTPAEPLAPLRGSDVLEATVAARVSRRFDRHTDGESDTESAGARVPKQRVDSAQKSSATPVEPPKPDLADSLVRAAMRWVTAGTLQGGPAGAGDAINAVNRVDDVLQTVPRREQPLPAVHEHNSAVATRTLRRNGDDAQSESQNEAHPTPAPLDLTVEESIPATALPIRAPLVTPAPLPMVAQSVRNEVVEVSIGAIHVRVDAPTAQTVARPALTPAASAPGAATSRPARSALSRRALRRI